MFARLLAASVFVALPWFAQAQELIEFDVSGKAGEHAEHGLTFTGSANEAGSSGSTAGRPGGDAGPAEPGQDAGRIGIELGQKTQGAVVIHGEIVDANGAFKKTSQEIQYGTKGHIVLKAIGGRGGDGGTGGTGEGGGRGSDGINATQVSWGTNGDDGGPGGPGGLGTDGKNGGKGGPITVRLPESQTKLLMLIKQEVSGGAPGKKGKHGPGGSGGDGGTGGSSYTWTTSREETTYSTDSEGNQTSSTTTHYDTHTNPGGSNGSSGPSGSTPTSALKDGTKGPDGKYLIQVVGADGKVTEYASRYDLTLGNYEISSDNRDGVLEPGELVHIEKLEVRNSGGMPTPAHTEAVIYLTNSQFTVADPVRLIIPKSLAPGETYVFSDKALKFRVQNNMLADAKSERSRWTDTIRPLSLLSDVERPFTNFDNPRSIEITYPIEVEFVRSLKSLVPGEATRFMIKITNISKRDYGADSDLKRILQIVTERSGGDLDAEHLKFFDKAGKPLDLNAGILTAIAKLKSGESALVEGIMGVHADAEIYRAGEVSNKLGLGMIETPEKEKVIQNPLVSVRASQSYSLNPNASVLLVTNTNTTREEVLAVKEQARKLGTEIAIWDVSLNGSIDLQKALEHGSSLMQDLKGKTVLVLDNDIEVGNERTKARLQLRRNDFLKALSEAGMGVVVVGQDKNLLNDFILPDQGSVAKSYDGIKSFMKEFNANQTAAEVKKNAGGDFTEVFTDIEVNRWSLWGKVTSSKHLEKTAAKLKERLAKMHPDRNYVVIYSFEPELVKRAWGVNTWRHGRIELRRTLDGSVGPGVGFVMEATGAARAEALKSNEMSMALMMGISFDKKLEILETLVSSNGARTEKGDRTLSFLIEAILADLAHEQGTLRTSAWKGRFGPGLSQIREKLPNLKKLSETKIRITQDSPEKAQQAIAKLVASIEFMALKQRTWLDWLITGRRNSDVSHETLLYKDKILKQIYQVEPSGGLLSKLWRLGKSTVSGESSLSLDEINRQIAEFSQDFLFRFNSDKAAIPDPRERARATVSANTKHLDFVSMAAPGVTANTLKPDDPRINHKDSAARQSAIAETEAKAKAERGELLVPYPAPRSAAEKAACKLGLSVGSSGAK